MELVTSLGQVLGPSDGLCQVAIILRGARGGDTANDSISV